MSVPSRKLRLLLSVSQILLGVAMVYKFRDLYGIYVAFYWFFAFIAVFHCAVLIYELIKFLRQRALQKGSREST